MIVKDVCSPCDNGWIDRLDHKTEPILNELNAGEPRTIVATEKHLLATWAVKTAVLINCVIGDVSFTKRDLATIKDDQTPPQSVGIWIAGCAYGQPVASVRYGRLTATVSTRTLSGEPVSHGSSALLGSNDHVYIATFRILHLGFQVFVPKSAPQFVPNRAAGAERVISQLWPLDLRPVQWPLSAALPDEQAFEAFAESFGGTAERVLTLPLG